MMESDYYDISISTNIDTGQLVSLLNDDTLLGSWEQDGTVHLYWPVQAWGEHRLNHLTQLLQQLGTNTEPFTIEISKCSAENWNARWAALVKPIRIGQRIMIRPSWVETNTSPGEIEIILDPKQAFGTGHHATTQLLLEWLEEIIRGGERVLDVGTGSGILAMVALRLGAKFALGIDHDPIAIECAREYARANNFRENLQLQVQDLENVDKQTFDLILANLDRRTWLNQAMHLQRVKLPKTLLLLSGILPDDQIDVTDSLAKMNWVLIDMRERDGWLALGFKQQSLK
ncbi:MAG: 50S ribosomal protein L11 methyltransferase [Nitrospirales bacterium]|nr:50S ribosomal protein L11 methyltransferase [Nitrospirales bacterium]